MASEADGASTGVGFIYLSYTPSCSRVMEMTTMKAWQAHAWGEPEEMTLADTAIPEPGAGEIRIANRAAALNFFDILQIQGKYQYKPPFPFTPGAEVAGTVDAAGAGVTGFAPGDRVLAMPQAGAFAQYSLAQ